MVSTLTPMELTVADRPVRPLTADEVMAMVQAGILGEDEHAELLCGVLTVVTKGDAHETVIALLTRWLAPLLVAGAHDVRIGGPLIVPDRTSLPEPDVLVVERDDTTIAHPSTALLAIEVSDSSLRIDTTVKPPLYAAAEVTELWVADILHRQLHVFSEPHPDGYAERVTLAPPARPEPRAVPAGPLDLGELFRLLP